MKNKTKINKWDLIKLQSGCTAKEIINKKDNPQNGKNYLQRKIPTRNSSLKRTNSSGSSISKKTNNWIKKWAKDLNRHFSKEGVQMARKHMKKCSVSLIIREMQIRSPMRYHLTPVKMVIIKKSTMDAGEGVERRETSFTVGGNVNWYSPYGEQYGGSLRS